MSTFIGRHPAKPEKCSVTFANDGKTVACDPGTNLYKLARENGINLFNGLAKAVHCRGLGCCGMCTVEVVPQSGVSRKRAREALRFWLLKGNLRMACQTTVRGDIVVTKHGGLKGKKGYRPPSAREEAIRLYRDEEKTLAEVSAETGLPVPKIVNILEKAGVEMRRTGSAA